MCGIAGFIGALDAASMEAVGIRMASSIVHRGPDDGGVWTDPQFGLSLAHRRLSILDLSPAGHQPMHSSAGRFVMIFNGEVYNHLSIRDQLQNEGIALNWRGHSDTETLLAGFEHWGIVPTLQRTVGMFAIALWDVQKKTLHLIRDRLGEKPLYYGWVGEGDEAAFVFGSELKALRAYPGFSNRVSRSALASYLQFMYVPAPQSIYENIYKLEPGCMLSMGADFPEPPSKAFSPDSSYDGATIERWWSLADVIESGSKNYITDETEALHKLESRLKDSVRLQSLADVPVGAFLSGGIDSSTIVSLMQSQATSPVKTFTVGFEEAGFDESPYAKAVANHLGTEHTELFVTASEAMSVIPHLATMYDEPFADASQIPTHLVCRAARQHVTVALSGDAGDEFFGGYNRYLWGPRIWDRLKWIPYPVRQVFGSLITSLPVPLWDKLGQSFNGLMPNMQDIPLLGDKAHKLAARLKGVQDNDDLYWSLVSEWQNPSQVVLGLNPLDSSLSEGIERLNQISFPSMGLDENQLRMMYLDSMSYLPDDILCKVDRAAMATSLETRIPFLDHRVVEMAWQLPLEMKIRNHQGKWALRKILDQYVPRELIDRPKVGFGIPIGQWLRGPLRSWAEDLLSEKLLQKQGYFNPSPIRKKWQEHLSGARDHTASLWAVLMFQAWLEHNN
jgi:asparagine synthase (glutamine-hydrolysing)